MARPKTASFRSQSELILVLRERPDARRTARPPSGTTPAVERALEAAKATSHFLFTDEAAIPGAGSSSIASVASEPYSLAFHRIDAPDETLETLAERLRALDDVEAAYVKPPAEPAVLQLDEPDVARLNRMIAAPDAPPTATPDYVSRQGYLNRAPVGVDARYAWTVRGGTGSGVSIIDVEGAWNFAHEDLQQ